MENSEKDFPLDENVNEVKIKSESLATLIGPAIRITADFKLGGQRFRGEVETNPITHKVVEAHIEAFLKSAEPIKEKGGD